MKKIKIVPIHGGAPGLFQDNYFGDVYLYPPTEFALDWRGRCMWSVWVRNSNKAVSYHRSEKAGLKAMRKVIDVYFDPTPATKLQTLLPVKI